MNVKCGNSHSTSSCPANATFCNAFKDALYEMY